MFQKIKRNFCLVLVGAAVSLSAQAELNLAEPEVMLAQAAKGKNELRETLNQIDQNLSEFRDRVTFDKYFYILDQLQELATKLNLDSIYPEAVRKVGGRMAQRGINWVDIMTDSEEKILYFNRWIPDVSLAFSYIYLSEQQVNAVTNTGPYNAVAGNIETFCKYQKVRWPTDINLHLGCTSLLSDLAVKAMKQTDLEEADILFWISKIFRSENMQALVVALQTQTFELTSNNAGLLHSYLKRAELIYRQVKHPLFPSSEGLQSQVGDLIVEVLVRFIRLQETFTTAEIQQALHLISAKHLASLTGSLQATGKTPDAKFGKSYFEFTLLVFEALKAKGLDVEAKLLIEKLSTKGAGLWARYLKLEGLYTNVDSRGRTYVLTIVNTSEDTLTISYLDQQTSVSRTFTHVIYDFDSRTFVASDRGIDSSSSPNWPIRIQAVKDGELTVTDLGNDWDPKPRKTKRTQKFPDLISDNEIPHADFSGLYKGNFPTKVQEFINVEMAINAFNGMAIANLKHPMLRATFNSGWEVKSGILYLTRTSNGRGGILHMRVKRTSRGFEGWVIIGGDGVMKQRIVMKKTN